MTGDGVLTLAILGVAVALLVTEWVRYDLVALGVLLALAISGLVPGPVAVGGFGDPAVITVAAVLVLSGGLYRTGVANLIGRRVVRLAGDSPVRLTLVLTLTAGLLSGIMNNIAVVALLLPVALDLSRRLEEPPSRILMPLAFATLLGGLTTLIGTAPNILISGALEAAGTSPFRMFDFAPVGLVALAAGVLYMTLLGRRLFPAPGARGTRAPVRPGERGGVGEAVGGGTTRFRETYDLDETLFTLVLPAAGGLAGRTLVESRLGRALGLGVCAVVRDGRTVRAPPPDFRLRGGDRVIAAGRAAPLEALRAWGDLREGGGPPGLEGLVDPEIGLAEVSVPSESALSGSTLEEVDFRNRFGLHVLSVQREGGTRRPEVEDLLLEAGDVLLVLGRRERLDALAGSSDLGAPRPIEPADAERRYGLERLLLRLRVPEGSKLEGLPLEETRLGEAFGLTVLEVAREGGRTFLPARDSTLRGGDALLVEGRREDVEVLEALQELGRHEGADETARLESERAGFAEVTLSPRTTLVGRTLAEVFFRERYGLTVLAIWRGGRSYHSNVRLRAMPLEFGDALLVYGARDRIRLLARDPDFLVLGEEVRELFRSERAPAALAIMGGVFAAASTGLAPIYLAAPAGALLMVASGCLSVDEAYDFVQWRVLVLIGGMLALGVALEQTGTARWVAEEGLGRAAALGPRGLLAGLFLLTALAAQVMPTTAVAVLMSPVALGTAASLQVSPHALMMVVAVGASAAFLSPFGHPVNLLVMGVGGYRVSDYTRAGLPLLLLLLAVALFVVPVFWPLAA